jgi:uncharacterized MAPEG superfamily protein
MTTDLHMLVWSVILCISMPVVYLIGRTQTPGGMEWGLGNREKALEGQPAWAGRAYRAHMNLVENLLPFAALVLVAAVSGRANGTTALGSELFFWGRLAHFLVYAAGIPYLRTGVFFVGTVGMLMILSQIL